MWHPNRERAGSSAGRANCFRRRVFYPELNARHHRFLNLVLRHSGVFVGRQYATFAGIAHGQKVHDFIGRVLAHGYARSIGLGPNGRTRLFHVHYKPLYRAIDETDNRHRRRPTIEQALEHLLVLDGVLMDRSLAWLGTEREKRAYFGALPGLGVRESEYPQLVFGRAPRRPSASFRTSCRSGTPSTVAGTCSSIRCTASTWSTSACFLPATSGC